MEHTPHNFPETESADSDIEARANYILGRLGLSWEDLKGKRILDVGAGSAEFGAAARTKGVDVVSLDRQLGDSDGPPYQKQGYVVGTADRLPFADESFDMVLSHASVPLLASNRREVLCFVEEIRRVLKKGGECRFGPVGMGGALFPQDETAGVEDRFEGMSEDEAVQETSLRTTAVFREMIPGIQNSTDDPMAQVNNFYSFKKP